MKEFICAKQSDCVQYLWQNLRKLIRRSHTFHVGSFTPTGQVVVWVMDNE